MIYIISSETRVSSPVRVGCQSAECANKLKMQKKKKAQVHLEGKSLGNKYILTLSSSAFLCFVIAVALWRIFKEERGDQTAS